MKIRCPIGMSLMRGSSGLVLCDSSTQGRWIMEIVDRDLAALLKFCSCVRDKEEVVRFLLGRSGCDNEIAHATISDLLESGILVLDDAHLEIPSRAALERWVQKGWAEAFHFHVRTNLLPKTDYSAESAYVDDIAAMRRKAAAEPLPANYKDYENAPLIQLARNEFQGIDDPPSLESILAETPDVPRTRRLDIQEFGWFVHRAYGQTADRRLPVSGRHVGKTSPSGGSRHPTEVYPVVLDVSGIDAGLYHYSVRLHAVEMLRSGDFFDDLRRHVFLSPQRPPFQPRVVFILTTIFERSMFRYREPRSYRVMHFDIGHLMQTSAYLAASVRRPCYRAYTMHDRDVEAIIGIDGISEAAMAFIAIG